MTAPEVTRYLAFPDELKTEEGARQLLEATLQAYDSPEPFFALAAEEKASRAFVGCCGINLLDGYAVELFYAVVPEYWGRGFATEMGQALTSYALDVLGVTMVKAFIVPGHEASKRVAEKLGFQEAGLVENLHFKEQVHQYILAKVDPK